MRKLAAAAALSVAAGIGVVAFAGVANAQSAAIDRNHPVAHQRLLRPAQ